MDRTRLRRKAQRGSHERAVIDEALVCHVGFTSEHGPVVIPTTFVRIGDDLYLHGATGNAMLSALAAGTDACLEVTLLDGLVLARTAFHHSVNYRSVVVFGRAQRVDDAERKWTALAALLDKLDPKRSSACRAPNAKELASTQVIAMPLAEASAKARTGPPLPDDGEDVHLPYWHGVVPLVTTRGTPVPAE